MLFMWNEGRKYSFIFMIPRQEALRIETGNETELLSNGALWWPTKELALWAYIQALETSSLNLTPVYL